MFGARLVGIEEADETVQPLALIVEPEFLREIFMATRAIAIGEAGRREIAVKLPVKARIAIGAERMEREACAQCIGQIQRRLVAVHVDMVVIVRRECPVVMIIRDGPVDIGKLILIL